MFFAFVGLHLNIDLILTLFDEAIVTFEVLVDFLTKFSGKAVKGLSKIFNIKSLKLNWHGLIVCLGKD